LVRTSDTVDSNDCNIIGFLFPYPSRRHTIVVSSCHQAVGEIILCDLSNREHAAKARLLQCSLRCNNIIISGLFWKIWHRSLTVLAIPASMLHHYNIFIILMSLRGLQQPCRRKKSHRNPYTYLNILVTGTDIFW